MIKGADRGGVEGGGGADQRGHIPGEGLMRVGGWWGVGAPPWANDGATANRVTGDNDLACCHCRLW